MWKSILDIKEIYEDESVQRWPFNFPPFNLKNNSTPDNKHPSIDNCQVLSKLRHLVKIWQPLKADKRVNRRKLISYTHQAFFVVETNAIYSKDQLDEYCGGWHHQF